MSAARSLDPVLSPCTLHRRHSPRLWRTVRHHVVPQSWTQQLGQPDSRLVTICDTSHYAIHSFIDLLRAGKGLPPQVPAGYRSLASEAIAWWRANGQPPVHNTSLEAI